jgi:hypothetical protein
MPKQFHEFKFFVDKPGFFHSPAICSSHFTHFAQILATQIMLQSGRVKTIDGDQIGKLRVIHQIFMIESREFLKIFRDLLNIFPFPSSAGCEGRLKWVVYTTGLNRFKPAEMNPILAEMAETKNICFSA